MEGLLHTQSFGLTSKVVLVNLAQLFACLHPPSPPLVLLCLLGPNVITLLDLSHNLNGHNFIIAD